MKDAISASPAPSKPVHPRRPVAARLSRSLPAAALSAFVAICWIGMPTIVLAEGGSAGGKIGDAPGGSGGGSAGGKIPPPPDEQPKPKADEPKVEPPERDARRPQRRRDEGGSRRGSREEKKEAGGFDGTWSVHTSSRCGWSSNTPIRISGSHISAAHLSGSVSPSGSVRMVSHYQGLTHTSSGRLSGSSGSGSFSRTDGCSGSWTASR